MITISDSSGYTGVPPGGLCQKLLCGVIVVVAVGAGIFIVVRPLLPLDNPSVRSNVFLKSSENRQYM